MSPYRFYDATHIGFIPTTKNQPMFLISFKKSNASLCRLDPQSPFATRPRGKPAVNLLGYWDDDNLHRQHHFQFKKTN